MARKYGVVTGSYGDEPNRRVDIFRTETQAYPQYRLSDAAKAPVAPRQGSARGTGPSTWAAGADDEAPVYRMHFLDVEQPAAVQGFLRPFSDDCALEWTAYGDRRRTQPVMGTATFTSKAAFTAAREQAGGGLRGAYRVKARPDGQACAD